VGDTGFEQPPKFSGKTAISAMGGAKSDANGVQGDLFDAELQTVIEQWPDLPDVEQWPDLPDAVKAGIIAMAHAAGK